MQEGRWVTHFDDEPCLRVPEPIKKIEIDEINRDCDLQLLTSTSQVEVRCPRGPGAAIAMTPLKAPEHPTGLPKPATQPRAPPRPAPRTQAFVTLKPKWLSGKEPYTRTQVNGPVTGEGGKGTLRELLHTKQRHAERTTNNKRKHMGWLRMYQTETPLDGIRPQHSRSHMSATNATNIRQTLNAKTLNA